MLCSPPVDQSVLPIMNMNTLAIAFDSRSRSSLRRPLISLSRPPSRAARASAFSVMKAYRRMRTLPEPLSAYDMCRSRAR
jgi:hypothetical protein